MRLFDTWPFMDKRLSFALLPRAAAWRLGAHALNCIAWLRRLAAIERLDMGY
jgi:hypothetical protein